MKKYTAYEFKQISLVINTGMTVIHSLLAIFFYYFNIRFMFLFNVGSVITYLLVFFAIKKQAVRTYITVSFTEVIAHMTAAVICCGWNTGFSYYCFGIIAVLYFLKYLYASKSGFKYVAENVSFIAAILFVSLRVFTWFFRPMESIPELPQKIIYTANTVIIFAIVWFSLFMYTKTSTINENRITQMAEFDELTQLFNRRKMIEILMTIRNEFKGKIFLTMFDIDDFKKINDTYGHDAGDYVLRTISAMISKACAEDKHAVACRWGGEEFLLAHEISGLRKDRDGELLVRRICNMVKRYDFNYDSNHIVITLTAGIARLTPELTAEQATKKADDNLYFGKNNGKNQVVFK
ncbi:MAG: GGDEF domain-containing protein [Treponema sp.]|nr:GGDEF domain-containing protein [Treponema sp.]